MLTPFFCEVVFSAYNNFHNFHALQCYFVCFVGVSPECSPYTSISAYLWWSDTYSSLILSILTYAHLLFLDFCFFSVLLSVWWDSSQLYAQLLHNGSISLLPSSSHFSWYLIHGSLLPCDYTCHTCYTFPVLPHKDSQHCFFFLVTLIYPSFIDPFCLIV